MYLSYGTYGFKPLWAGPIMGPTLVWLKEYMSDAHNIKLSDLSIYMCHKLNVEMDSTSEHDIVTSFSWLKLRDDYVLPCIMPHDLT